MKRVTGTLVASLLVLFAVPATAVAMWGQNALVGKAPLPTDTLVANPSIIGGGCQLGNHGLVRSRTSVVSGTLVAEDGCPLRTVAAFTNTNSQGWTNGNPQGYVQQLSWYQDVVNTGHFNGIRVGIPWDTSACLSEGDTLWVGGTAGPPATGGIALAYQYLDQLLSFTQQTGLYMMITFFESTADGVTQGCTKNVPTDANNWWGTVGAVAARYANQTNVIYELVNEPDFGSNVSGCGLATGLDSIYQTVRAIAPSTPLIAWTVASYTTFTNGFGCGAGTEQALLTAAPDINYANAVVGWHGYDRGTGFSGMLSFIAATKSLGYPQMATEGWPFPSGPAGNVTDFYTFVADMEAQNLSWQFSDGWPAPGGPLTISWPKD